MRKLVVFILLSMSLLRCNIYKEDSRGILVESITNRTTERLKELRLINKNDTLLGVCYHISDEPDNQVEDYTFFTSTKLVRYFGWGNRKPEISEAQFNKTLSISRKLDSVYSRVEINVETLYKILYDSVKQENFALKDDIYFYINYGEQRMNQERFYELLIDTWKKSKAYPKMIEVKNRYFDSERNKKD